MSGSPPELLVTSRSEWRAWLEENHATSGSIWLVSYKKASGKPRISYEESVEEALCFGWIDSRSGSVDEQRSKLWLARRKPGSGWSRTNKERVERLLAAGLVAEAGLGTIEAAKADGSWTALDASEAGTVPPDLAAALAAHPPARTEWEAFSPSVRTGILHWIGSARRPGTRAKRIDETAAKASRGEKANQWVRRV